MKPASFTSAFLFSPSSYLAVNKCPLPHSEGSISSSAINVRRIRKVSPGSELFPDAGSSYIPSGLSSGEWEQIKKKENREVQNKDFAAWGPRFAKSDRPNDDWMVLPGLWTSGFNSNKNGVQSVGSSGTNVEQGSTRSRVLQTLPVYAFACIFMELLLAAAYLFHKKEAASLITIAVLKLKRSAVTSVATVSYTMLMKMSGLKLLLSLALVKPLEAMILKFMDKFQCSRRIALAYFTAGSIGSISVFSLMFFLLQRFVVY